MTATVKKREHSPCGRPDRHGHLALTPAPFARWPRGRPTSTPVVLILGLMRGLAGIPGLERDVPDPGVPAGGKVRA